MTARVTGGQREARMILDQECAICGKCEFLLTDVEGEGLLCLRCEVWCLSHPRHEPWYVRLGRWLAR